MACRNNGGMSIRDGGSGLGVQETKVESGSDLLRYRADVFLDAERGPAVSHATPCGILLAPDYKGTACDAAWQCRVRQAAPSRSPKEYWRSAGAPRLPDLTLSGAMPMRAGKEQCGAGREHVCQMLPRRAL